MKIGLITQWFPPERGSAALPGTIADALARRGHNIDVVTAFPNYPEGELQEGWRQRWGHSERRGESIMVHRTPIYVSHDERAWRRMVNYLSFALSASLTSFRKLRTVDVVWVHGTPVLPALPAMVLKRFRGTPFVLHIQDLWPDTVTASGMLPRWFEPLVRLPLEWFCRRAYANASIIGIITPGMRHVLVERGVSDEKIVEIPNWADESIFHPVAGGTSTRESLGLPPGFVAMYAGAIGEVQGLETLVQAAAHLRSEDVHVAIVGDGVAKTNLQNLSAELGADNITFVRSQPLERMGEVLASADMQIVCLKDLPLYRITLPSKVQATLAAGRPIIVSAGGDAGEVVTTAAAGLAVPPGDAGALASALLTAARASARERESWGASGRRYYEDELSEAVGLTRMTCAMEQAIVRHQKELA